MPVQKTVTTGRKPKARAGARARKPRNVRDSPTPGAIPAEQSAFKLKINPPRATDRGRRNTTPAFGFGLNEYGQEQADEQPEENEELPVARRSGREIKTTQKDDFVYGSDVNFPSSVGEEVDKDGEGGYRGAQGYSPLLLQNSKTKRGPGRPPKGMSSQPSFRLSKSKSDRPTALSSKDKPIQPTLPTILEDAWPTDPNSSRRRSPPKFDDKVEDCVDQIIGNIGCGPKVAVELPTLRPAGVEVAYTAKLLMRLYMRAHKEGKWHVCDLVADTWIRAFHAKRRRQERSEQFDDMCWRYNEPLSNRRAAGQKGYDRNAPNFTRVLKEEDPLLDKDITDFNPGLLSQLYTEADGHCAARLLWADTMALCGSKLETRMQIDKRHSVNWHPKLIYDIMCTTLRMMRRKLTLKIEEATEGAWCKRYHMHTLYGTPCYRKTAYDRKVAGEDSSDEDESDEEERMALVMGTDLTLPSTGGLGTMDGGDAVMDDAMDEDAEGEPDDEYAAL